MAVKFNSSRDQVKSILKTKMYKIQSWNEIQSIILLFDCFVVKYCLALYEKNCGIYRKLKLWNRFPRQYPNVSLDPKG